MWFPAPSSLALGKAGWQVGEAGSRPGEGGAGVDLWRPWVCNTHQRWGCIRHLCTVHHSQSLAMSFLWDHSSWTWNQTGPLLSGHGHSQPLMPTDIPSNELYSLFSHHSMHVCVCVLWCPTLCDPMDWRPPGFPVYGIFQARILKWVSMPFSRGSSWPRDRTHISCVSCIGRQILYH